MLDCPARHSSGPHLERGDHRRNRVLAVIISRNANLSNQVKREVERAVSKGVLVVPFRIEDVAMSKELEYFLSSQHWLDALTPPIEQHLMKLAELVARLLSDSNGVSASAIQAPSAGKVLPTSFLRTEPHGTDRRAHAVLITAAVLGALLFLAIAGARRFWPVHEQPLKAQKVPHPDKGMKIVSMNEDSPSASAGLRQGDVIIAVDGAPVTNRTEWLRTFVPGEHKLKYWELKRNVIREVDLTKSAAGEMGFEIRSWGP
jgi:hypothetical protein